jgi:hypothetical protein
MQLFSTAFLAILFLQSGLDKLVDRKGNLEYIRGYFAKSPLARGAASMFWVLTVLEVSTGVMSALGVVYLLYPGSPQVAFLGASLATVCFLSLFFGQRMTKDYASASAMAPYFLVGLAAMLLTGHG